MQLNPARGRKHANKMGTDVEMIQHGFMQLNPARGRKLVIWFALILWRLIGLCSSTSRGDGNFPIARFIKFLKSLVYAAQPREGTETHLTRQSA